MNESKNDQSVLRRAPATPGLFTIYIFCILLYCSCMLLQDHIQEVLDKWESIDDEIWAKVIIILIVFPSSLPHP